MYGAVRDWVCAEYGIDPEKIVRPFYPGGDFERFDYGAGAVVVDNPPFSILAQIQRFYLARKIPFFLFCPTLTAFSGKDTMNVCHLICDMKITYENGAVVNTSFVTNLEPGIVARSAPALYQAVKEANRRNLAQFQKAPLPKYRYPDQLLTAAGMRLFSQNGIDFCVHANDCFHISRLDAQRAYGKAIYGGGILLSDPAAAEKAAVEEVIVWELSERERAIVKRLGRKEEEDDGEG